MLEERLDVEVEKIAFEDFESYIAGLDLNEIGELVAKADELKRKKYKKSNSKRDTEPKALTPKQEARRRKIEEAIIEGQKPHPISLLKVVKEEKTRKHYVRSLSKKQEANKLRIEMAIEQGMKLREEQEMCAV
jgi:hypothetical protein